MTLKNRLAKLEQRAGGGRCPECGFPPDPGEKVEFDITMPTYGEPEPPEPPDPGPEFCQVCGQQLWFKFLWANAPESPPIPPLGCTDEPTEGVQR